MAEPAHSSRAQQAIGAAAETARRLCSKAERLFSRQAAGIIAYLVIQKDTNAACNCTLPEASRNRTALIVRTREASSRETSSSRDPGPARHSRPRLRETHLAFVGCGPALRLLRAGLAGARGAGRGARGPAVLVAATLKFSPSPVAGIYPMLPKPSPSQRYDDRHPQVLSAVKTLDAEHREGWPRSLCTL